MVTTAPGTSPTRLGGGSPGPPPLPNLRQKGLSRLQLALRLGVVLAAIIFAYQYSLTTLIRGLSLDTPLAYLGLVPFIALAMVAARNLSARNEPDIHDRYVDYIIGVPFLLAALTIVTILPVHASTFFWLWRLDLLSLPLFVAGCVAIVFGVRTLWRLKLPIAFLFLAWPLPYLTLLNGWLQRFTDLTVAALTSLVHLLPVAVPVAGYDGSVFSVGHGDQAFLVSIASACAGVNGMVGFVLVGVAFAALVHGRILPKLAWLLGGMALLWILNLLRILLIFLVGQAWGQGAAIDVLHPFIGLVTFNLGVLAMILALPLFRLRIGSGTHSKPSRISQRLFAVRPGRPPVARARVALLVVLIGAGIAGLANAQMQQFELLAQDLGTPRLAELSQQDIQVAGWSLAQTDSYPWVSRYFGDDASWTRYSYDFQAGVANPSAFRSSESVVLDVISTSDLGSFSVYGLQACYRFHNYRIMDAHQVDLAGGLTGHSVVYYNLADQSNWLAVYWEWPVSTSTGQRYERVVVNMVDPGGDYPVAPPLSTSLTKTASLAISDWFGDSESQRLQPSLTAARNFLIGFSQEIVRSAASHGSSASSATTPGVSG